MNIQPIRNVSDCVPLYIPHSLYLKPIAKFNISVVLPPTSQPGKTISNWDVMEKLREIIAPDQFSMLKVTKSAIDFLRFEAESEDRAKVKTILSRLDGSSINLKAYTDVIKVRANEEKNEYPTRHHWDTYFRDTIDMDEMKCGERPDTLHISNLPIQWFCPRHLQNDDGVKPSESIFKRIFEKFGSIRSVDIPICDPYRKDMKSHMTGMKSFTFDQELYFEGYVQFSEYVGFVKAMDEFRGMKLVRKEIDQNLSVSIKVDFDKSKHLSEMSIKRRKFVRDRLIAKERAKEETERRQIQLEAEKKEQEKRRQEEIEKMEMEKQRLREEQRKEKNLKKLRAKDQHEIDSKIRDEEKQLLIVQRRLESIRIIDSLFERIKTKKMMLDMEEVKSEKKKRITYGHTNKTTTSSAPTTVNPNDATRNKLLKRIKVTYEQDYERYRNRVQKVKAGSTILGVALNDRSKISPIKKSDGLTTHNNNDDDDDDDEQQHTSDKTKKKKKKKKLKSKKKKKRLNSTKDSSSSDSSSSSSSSSDSESSSNKSSSEQIHNNQPPMVPPNMISGGAGGGYPMMHPMATNPWMNMGMYSMPRAPYYDGMTYEQPMHNPSSYPVNMIRMPTMGIRRPVGYVPYRFRGGGGGRPFYRGRGRGYPPYSGNYNNNHQFGNSNEMNDINYERRSNEYISKSRSRSHSRRSRSRSRRTRSSYSRSRSRSRSRSYSRSRRSNRGRSTSAKSSHNRSHHSRSRSNNSSIKSKTRNNEITDGPGGAGAGAGKPSSSSTNVHRSRSITSRHSSSRTRKYYRPSTASRSASRSRSKSSNRSTRSNRSRRLLPPSRTETDNNKTSQNNKDYKEYNNNNNKNIIAVKDLRHKLKASKENASLSSPPSPSTGTLSSEQRKKENNRRDVQKQPIRRKRSITPPPPTKNRNTRKSYSRHSSKSDSSDSSNDDDDDDDKHKHKHDGRSMMKSRHPQQSKVNQRSSDRSHGSNSHPRSHTSSAAAAAAAPSSSGSSSEKSDRSDRVRSTKGERHSKSSASHSKSATSNNRSADNRRRSRSSRSRSHSRSDSPPNRSRTPPSAHTPTN